MSGAEEKIMIPAGHGRLEAGLAERAPDRFGIVCHPHSLYGGSMNNNVVDAGIKALARTGFSSIRFNFRGVGASTGEFDQGRGEREDLAAVVEFCRERGAGRIVIVGYSFGAHVAAFAWGDMAGPELDPLILIAPPAAFMSFNGLAPQTRIGLMVCGENDDIAPPQMAKDIGDFLNEPLRPKVIGGADHFFGGREPEIIDLVVGHLAG